MSVARVVYVEVDVAIIVAIDSVTVKGTDSEQPRRQLLWKRRGAAVGPPLEVKHVVNARKSMNISHQPGKKCPLLTI